MAAGRDEVQHGRSCGSKCPIKAVGVGSHCWSLGSVMLRVFLREALRTLLKQNSAKAEPRAGLMGGTSLPQNVLGDVWCGAEPGPRSSAAVRPCPPRNQRVQQSVGQAPPALETLSFCFQCPLLASGSLNFFKPALLLNRHFHTCLQLDPLCAQTAHV